MATKTSFSYYPVDTDRYSDIKIKRLKKSFGGNGVAVYDYLLCEIYRDKGCFLVWDECRAFDVADYFGLKESTVEEIVRTCCKCGLFDKAVFASGSVITSASIQRRYLEMCNRSKRKDMTIPTHINLLGDMQITEEKQKIPEKQPKITEELPKVPELFDKEKKSKVKERKEKVCVVETPPKVFGGHTYTHETFEERKNKFFTEVMKFSDRYSAEMLNKFFNYWTQSNGGSYKMLWEKERDKKAFEISRRLGTWNSIEFKNNRNYGTNNPNTQRTAFTRETLESVVDTGFALYQASRKSE